MEVTTLNEHDLAEMLRFIRGEGHPWGKGIHTYPTRDDANKQRIYALCEELERRGLVYRKTFNADEVWFGPTPA